MTFFVFKKYILSFCLYFFFSKIENIFFFYIKKNLLFENAKRTYWTLAVEPDNTAAEVAGDFIPCIVFDF